MEVFLVGLFLFGFFLFGFGLFLFGFFLFGFALFLFGFFFRREGWFGIGSTHPFTRFKFFRMTVVFGSVSFHSCVVLLSTRHKEHNSRGVYGVVVYNLHWVDDLSLKEHDGRSVCGVVYRHVHVLHRVDGTILEGFVSAI